MLTMYNLMLVSVESVWERFQSPTDSKNDQNLRCISHNPLQQGFQYKWSSAAVHHWSFIIGFLESLHANRPISKSFESCSKPLKPHTVIGILPNFTGDELLGTKTKYSNRVVEMLSFSLDMLQCRTCQCEANHISLPEIGGYTSPDIFDNKNSNCFYKSIYQSQMKFSALFP